MIGPISNQQVYEHAWAQYFLALLMIDRIDNGFCSQGPPHPMHSTLSDFMILFPIKFIYSEKATKFFEISTVDLSYVVPVKSTVEISQNFVAFSEYMNFNWMFDVWLFMRSTRSQISRAEWLMNWCTLFGPRQMCFMYRGITFL